MVIYVDGSITGNPGGVVGYGWHVEGQRTQGHGLAFKGGENATNNVAEYTAVVAALTWLLPRCTRIRDRNLEIRSDSEITVNQLSGNWRVKHANLKPIAAIAHIMLEQLDHYGWTVEFTWIPREKNNRADSLSRLTVKRHLKDRLPLTKKMGEYVDES